MHIDVLAHPLRPDDCQELIDLLIDSVENGASIGFLAPLRTEEARDYWLAIANAVTSGNRIILVARETLAGPIVGSAQIALEARANGRHRAEVQKVLVRSTHRRRGIARLLMAEIEARARMRGVRLLFLDTRERGRAREFYETLGYVHAGGIPDWALDPDGSPAKNAIYYKELTQ